MRMKMVLSPFEQRLVKALAKERNHTNRKNNVDDQKIGPQSAAQPDIDGVGAEIAFCKMFNLYPDLQLAEYPTHDAITHDGWSVDVKLWYVFHSSVYWR